MQFNQYENSASLDIGALQGAPSENELRRIVAAHPFAVLDKTPALDYRIHINICNIVPVREHVLTRFFLAGGTFEEQFLV